MKILLVDDDPEILELTSNFLKKDGHTITSAKNGVEALQKISNSNFDLIVSDVIMPRKTGLSLVKDIIQIDKKMPVILISGHFNGEEEKLSGIKSVAVLKKPFSPHALLDLIKSHTGKE